MEIEESFLSFTEGFCILYIYTNAYSLDLFSMSSTNISSSLMIFSYLLPFHPAYCIANSNLTCTFPIIVELGGDINCYFGYRRADVKDIVKLYNHNMSWGIYGNVACSWKIMTWVSEYYTDDRF